MAIDRDKKAEFMEIVNAYTPPESNLGKSLNKEVNLASLSNRLLASLIDGVLHIIVWFSIFYFYKLNVGNLTEIPALFSTAVITIVGFGIFVLMHGYLLIKNGQTIGKLALGIRIVSNRTNAVLPIWRVVLFRYLPITVFNLVPVLTIIDILFIFRQDRRCIHDFLAGTKVVDA